MNLPHSPYINPNTLNSLQKQNKNSLFWFIVSGAKCLKMLYLIGLALFYSVIYNCLFRFSLKLEAYWFILFVALTNTYQACIGCPATFSKKNASLCSKSMSHLETITEIKTENYKVV